MPGTGPARTCRGRRSSVPRARRSAGRRGGRSSRGRDSGSPGRTGPSRSAGASRGGGRRCGRRAAGRRRPAARAPAARRRCRSGSRRRSAAATREPPAASCGRRSAPAPTRPVRGRDRSARRAPGPVVERFQLVLKPVPDFVISRMITCRRASTRRPPQMAFDHSRTRAGAARGARDPARGRASFRRSGVGRARPCGTARYARKQARLAPLSGRRPGACGGLGGSIRG